jgi:OHCU decarboxylase
MTQPISLEALNRLDRAAFTARLGHIFEHSPWVAESAWEARPFASEADLHRALCDAMYAAGEERQLALIAAHPDLVGRAALAGTLTPDSTREQASAGLGSLSPDEVARFKELNAAYRARFGFPFVICARENKKAAILAGFDARLDNTREQEIATALGEIAKIAWYRLVEAVQD